MSAILSIESYRKYKDFKIELKHGKLTLIQGPSGSGKTSLIECIRWILYGNVAHIQDIFSSKRSKASLEINEICITRSTKPHYLCVFKKETLFENDAAQNIVDNMFGTRDLFELSAYLRQDDIPCPMLSASNKVRLYYITKLCFIDDKFPEEIIGAIYDTMKEVETEYNHILSEYENQLKIFNNYLSERKINQSVKQDLLSNDNYIDLLKNEIVTLKNKLEEYKRNIIRKNGNNNQIEKLLEQKKNVEERLSKISYVDIIEKEYLLNNMRLEIDRYKPIVIETTDLYNKIKIEYNKAEILLLENKNKENELKKVGEEISNIKIVNEKIVLTAREVYKIEEEYKLYKNNIEKLFKCKYKLEEYTKEYLEQILKKLNEDLYATTVYKCPMCLANLCMDGTKHELISSNISPRSIDINSTKSDIQIITQVVNKFVNNPSMTPEEANNILKRQELEKKRQTIQLTPNINDNITKMEQQRDIIFNNKKQVDDGLKNVTDAYKKLENELNNIRSENIKQKTIEEEGLKHIKWIETQIEDLSKEEQLYIESFDINILEKNIEELDQKLDDAYFAHKMIKLHKELGEKRLIVTNKLVDVKDLSSLYNGVFTKYYDRIRTLIESVNSALHNKAEDLFSFPLTVTLSLTQKMKKTGRYKPKISLDIIYKGKECNPFHHLSYGQRKRLSLLISMAINTLTRIPIILYDEILTNVDIPTRENCIKSIKETVRDDVIILCTELHGDEREYDEIISLDL